MEAFFLHLVQVCDHLGLLPGRQGVDLFNDLGSIRILLYGDIFGFFKFTLPARSLRLIDRAGRLVSNLLMAGHER